MTTKQERGKAAYFFVDLSELEPDIRATIFEDANAGGGEYGVRVVEEVHNGPARQSIYGVYWVDQDKYEQAKKDLGFGASVVSDDEVVAEEGTDPRKEAALIEAAREEAQAEADRINTLQAGEVAAIVGDDAPAVTNKLKK